MHLFLPRWYKTMERTEQLQRCAWWTQGVGPLTELSAKKKKKEQEIFPKCSTIPLTIKFDFLKVYETIWEKIWELIKKLGGAELQNKQLHTAMAWMNMTTRLSGSKTIWKLLSAFRFTLMKYQWPLFSFTILPSTYINTPHTVHRWNSELWN